MKNAIFFLYTKQANDNVTEDNIEPIDLTKSPPTTSNLIENNRKLENRPFYREEYEVYESTMERETDSDAYDAYDIDEPYVQQYQSVDLNNMGHVPGGLDTRKECKIVTNKLNHGEESKLPYYPRKISEDNELYKGFENSSNAEDWRRTYTVNDFYGSFPSQNNNNNNNKEDYSNVIAPGNVPLEEIGNDLSKFHNLNH